MSSGCDALAGNPETPAADNAEKRVVLASCMLAKVGRCDRYNFFSAINAGHFDVFLLRAMKAAEFFQKT